MKVLITAPSLDEAENISGISSVARQIVANCDAEFIHFTAGRKDGGKAGARWLFYQAVLIPAFLARLKQSQPDVVHINTALTRLSILRDYALTRAAKRAGFLVLLHVHGGKYLTEGFARPVYARMTRRMLRSADRVAVLSAAERTLAAGLAGSEENFCVLENAVPLDQLVSRESVRPQKATITFLGRLHAGKGLAEIVEACRILKESGFDFRFECFGRGPEEGQFVRAMSEVLADDFFFGAVVSGAAKWQALARSSIFLLPSHYEGLPMSLLEAMAAGSIPVVSDVGSVGEAVKDGVNGFLTVPRDVSSIVRKLKTLLAGDANESTLRANAQNTIREGFSLNAYVSKLEGIYVELAS